MVLPLQIIGYAMINSTTQRADGEGTFTYFMKTASILNWLEMIDSTNKDINW